MSDSDDSDSILPNLQKTRDLWNEKSGGESLDYLIPKSQSPTKPVHSNPPVEENHVNGTAIDENVVRSEDKNEDDFDMPDVKSMKSQWEKAGPSPVPKKSTTVVVVERKTVNSNHETPELVPVNRDQEETKEEYDVKLGALREKFEMEAKAASSKVVWRDEPRSSVSKAAVGAKKDLNKTHASQSKARNTSSTKTSSNKRFEVEIEAQKHYHSTKEGPVEMPAVELSSIKQQFEQRKDEKMVVPTRPSAEKNKKARQISMSSDTSTPAAEIVRYDDKPAEEEKYEVEISSLRKRFEQGGSYKPTKPTPRSRPPVQKKVSHSSPERQRSSSESDNTTEIVRASEAQYDEMIGEESVKDRLARYKAMTEAAKPQKTQKFSYKRRSTADLVIKKPAQEEEVPHTEQDQEIVRSPPAGTKEKPDYKASIDLEQARQLFEQQSTSPTRSGRSSRSSTRSPQRRSPRSQSTPSPIHRTGSRSSSSSKSPSPVRPASRHSNSSRSSGRRSPAKKPGDPDVVVLEHTEVNYYYEDGTRLSTRTKSPDYPDKLSDDMSNAEVIKPAPAGTKEEADFVPSVNLHSVRSMFENPKEEDFSRGRAPPKKVVIERQVEDESTGNSPERNPDIVRSTAAGAREEVQYEMSIDLKSARSKFESPHRTENYVPRNRIKEREEEVRRQRAAAAAASPRSSESSDSGYEVVKTTEAGSKEKPEYQVNLMATKQMFEGGKAPTPVKRETKTRQQVEIKGEIVRPEPAGTKEVVEIQASNDISSVKKKFEGTSLEEPEEEMKRKSPIDIQEEARMVIRKEREVKEEVQKPNEEPQEPPQEAAASSSDSEHTDTEGEVVLEADEDARQVTSEGVEGRHDSVSSEELVEKEVEKEEEEEVKEEEGTPQQEMDKEEVQEVHEEEENQRQEEEGEEEPAAAVVPVRVTIPEDLTEKKEEAESQQEYGTYAKVIDYNEEVQHPPQSSSDSESEKADEQDVRKDEQIITDDGLKQNGYQEDNVDSSYASNEVGNHLDDSLSSDDQKGISSTSSNQEDSQQQLSLSSSSQAEEVPAEGDGGYLQ